MKNLISLFVVLVGMNSAHAFKIDSPEKAYDIPEITSAVEKMTLIRNTQCNPGRTYERRIELNFKGLKETFSGFPSSTFQADTCQQARPGQQCQQQCQQQQYSAHGLHSNRGTSSLYYVTNVSSLDQDFYSLQSQEIQISIEAIIKDGPLLVVDGGNAWKYFDNFPYKSELRTEHDQYTNKEVKLATDGSSVCAYRKTWHNYGGNEDVFCVIPLKAN